MRKLIFGLLLFSTCFSLYIFTQRKRIDRRAVIDLPSVTAVFPVDQATLMKAIVKGFQENKPPPPDKFSRFSLAQVGAEEFPAEYQLKHYQDDQSTARYQSIPQDRRNLDFYLYDFSEGDNPANYWASEYYQGDRPALFRCNFIIHHEPDGNGATRVEVFEFIPRVLAGKKFALERHGPGYFSDIRKVAPTTSDRIEVLELIKQAVRR